MRGYRLIAYVAGMTLVGSPAMAATRPPGRDWAPVENVTHPDIAQLLTTTFVRDATGRPALVGAALRNDDVAAKWVVLAWKDPGWKDSLWSSGRSGHMPTPVLADDGSLSLLSVTTPADLNGYPRLALWSLDEQIAAPETIAVTTTQLSSFAYSAAITPAVRWAARAEQRPGESFVTRVYRSAGSGTWQETAQFGNDILNCAITALDDSRALLVVSGFASTNWTVFDGTAWSPLFLFPRRALGMRFVNGPGGARWLVSAGPAAMHVDAWNGTGWTPVDTLEAVRDPGRGFVHIGWCEPAIEGGTRPAITWQENWSAGPVWHSEGHGAWPTETGWSPGFQIPQSDSMDVGPTVLLDPNGDAWVAWGWNYSTKRWTHTYVTAKTAAPGVERDGAGVRVTWQLSESAPLSRWSVQRDPGTGVFAVVATLTASTGTAMEWHDAAPPQPGPGGLRYRIHRESVDAAYGWDSEVTEYHGAVDVPDLAVRTEPLRLSAVRNPVGAAAAVELRGADAGDVELQVFDVRGRFLSRQHVAAGGPAVAIVRVDLSRLPAGVLFVRAVQGGGRVSPAFRLVRLD
jgi:hypothetical protein